MKLFLKNAVNQLRTYSQSLDKKSLLIEKPWVLVNNPDSYQKLIFKRNGEMVMSSNGKVDIGKWEYLGNARSLLLDRNTDKILLNHGYFDEKALLLKIDGQQNEFFLLANENALPDLDVLGYLDRLRQAKFFIQKIDLKNGMRLEVHNGVSRPITQLRGLTVSIEAEQIPDGSYMSKAEDYAVVVANNRIRKVIHYRTYLLANGIQIQIHQQYFKSFELGDQVFLNDEPLANGIYELRNGKKLTIENGKIKKVKGKWWQL